MININAINHLTFAVSDLERALNFYQDTLGFELLARWDTGAYLQAGSVWLCLSVDEATKQQPLPEYSHVAFNVEQTDFVELKNYLLEHNIPIWKENKSEGDSLYILDPDHNKLELHASTLENRLQAMREKPYAGQWLKGQI